MELWNLPTSANILYNVSLLNDTATQYQSCDNSSVGSAVLVNTTLNTAIVAYYTGTTPGSSACFVCDESSGYAPNTTTTVRVCQNDTTWSGNPIICGMYVMKFVMHYIILHEMCCGHVHIRI